MGQKRENIINQLIKNQIDYVDNKGFKGDKEKEKTRIKESHSESKNGEYDIWLKKRNKEEDERLKGG